jgi:hypothetical protein
VQVSTAFKQIRKIKDDRFEEENIHEYTLLLNIGIRDCQIAVLNHSQVLYLEDFIFPAVASPSDLHEAVEQMFDQHPFIKAGFWREIKIAFKNQKFIQVPSDLFDVNASERYLKFNAHVHPVTDVIHHHTLSLSRAVTVFAVPLALQQFMEETYPQRQFSFVHQSSALIEGIMAAARTQEDQPLYVYIDRFKFHILYVNNGQLTYYNQFSIHNFQDYIKYIMLVMNSLRIDQQTSQVIVWGYLGNNSPHYHEFYQYVQNVTFGTKPAQLHYGYVFDEVQDHQYFDLFGIGLL